MNSRENSPWIGRPTTHDASEAMTWKWAEQRAIENAKWIHFCRQKQY